MPHDPHPLQTAALPDFFLSGPGHRLAAEGQRARLPAGGLATLAARAAGFFAGQGDGPRLLVGAVPYARGADDHLFQPQTLLDPAALRLTPLPRLAPARILPEPPAARYRQAVAAAVARIGAGEFDKIVLSRSLRILSDAAHDPAALLADLRDDPLATAFAVALPPRAGKPRRLLGATPELLVARRGRAVVSHPLAGSARRQPDRGADQAAGAALLRSDKDLREHAIAAEMVLDTLAPYCATLSAPEGIALTATARMWHLGTRIEGRLKDAATDCATLLAALHPTPAVCGLPHAPAEAAIPGLEGYDRGFYAGAVGWLEPDGDGAWYLALRCAEVSGHEARLYAGAGIVAGSDPAAEEAETSAKFLAMLAAFHLDEHGNPLEAAA